MKKVYMKPEIVFEDFSLSTSIAACDNEVNSADLNSCGVDDGDGNMIMNQGVTGCAYTPPGIQDKVCYHPPGGFAVFGSW